MDDQYEQVRFADGPVSGETFWIKLVESTAIFEVGCMIRFFGCAYVAVKKADGCWLFATPSSPEAKRMTDRMVVMKESISPEGNVQFTFDVENPN